MNNFEIISKLGEGSYSTVYKVKRKIDSKIYALKKVRLKKLSDKEKENSINEVRILASINSPHVISYKEAFLDETSQNLCIIMEFADKGDLYQKICLYKKNKKSFDELEVWKIFIQMTKGLKSLHDLNILHRDLKSANIFLFSNNSAKIGDLNVSKVVKKGLGYTQTGTPYYASPEVWNDEPYDKKSDIWSLACVTYEMLTLSPPFTGNSMDDLYQKVIKGKFNKIDDKYSFDIWELLKKLLKVNPKERPDCNEILKMSSVMKRIELIKYGYEKYFCDNENNKLLKTIRVPENLNFLKDKLPKANYEKTDPNVDFDININKSYLSNKIVLPSISQVMKVKKDNEKNIIKDNKDNKDIEKSPKRFDYNTPINNRILELIKNSEPKRIMKRNSKGSKISILNKGMSELYKLYVSNDSKKVHGNNRYKPNIIYGMYLPNIYMRRDGSAGNIKNKVVPNRKLSPLKS